MSGSGTSSTTLPFFHISGKVLSTKTLNSSSSTQYADLAIKVMSSDRLNRSNTSSTELHPRTVFSFAARDENEVRVMETVNLVNTSEATVESVSDNHLVALSAFAYSSRPNSSFCNTVCRLKLSRGQWKELDNQIDESRTFLFGEMSHLTASQAHTYTRKHTLVRVVQKESKVSTEERLKAVEERLGSVERQLGSINEQLGSVRSAQEELSKMRQLFGKLFKNGVEQLSSDPLTKRDVLGTAMA